MSAGGTSCQLEERVRLRPAAVLTASDAFAAGNAAAFAGAALALRWPEKLPFHPAGHPGESAIYFSLLAILILLGWRWLRGWGLPWQLLGLFQITFLGALVGTVIPCGGVRLYDHALLGVGLDKVVHFLFGCAGACLLGGLLRGWLPRPVWIPPLFGVAAALGVGALWEVVEYGVLLWIPLAWVGGYENTMGDLLANTLGASASLVLPRSWTRLTPPGGRSAEDR